MNSDSSPEKIRLFLVDDSEVVRAGLHALLGSEPCLLVVGEAPSVATALAACRELQPDVVLLDIRLPDGNGIDACRQILKIAPETRVLILSSVIDESVVDGAIRAGAHGYLLKEIDGRALVQAIRDVAAGQSILDPAITARVLALMRANPNDTRHTLAVLSQQEKRVLSLIARGCTNKEVAAELGLSEKTVRNYVSTVFEKLHVSRRAEAAVIYAQGSKA